MGITVHCSSIRHSAFGKWEIINDIFVFFLMYQKQFKKIKNGKRLVEQCARLAISLLVKSQIHEFHFRIWMDEWIGFQMLLYIYAKWWLINGIWNTEIVLNHSMMSNHHVVYSFICFVLFIWSKSLSSKCSDETNFQ